MSSNTGRSCRRVFLSLTNVKLAAPGTLINYNQSFKALPLPWAGKNKSKRFPHFSRDNKCCSIL